MKLDAKLIGIVGGVAGAVVATGLTVAGVIWSQRRRVAGEAEQ